MRAAVLQKRPGRPDVAASRYAGSRHPDAGERAFAYAKACGIIGKSFVGKRLPALGKPNSLVDLGRMLFPDVHRELPGQELLADLERRILRRTIRHIISILNSYVHPPEMLIRQLRSCEYADLKTCLRHISAGKPVPPMLSDIGRFGTVHFEAYPDLEAMLADTEFEFILAHDLGAIASPDYDFIPLETELDLRYYSLLVQSMRRLSIYDRYLAEHILAEEISLRNCTWALRLRTYYHKSPEEAAEYLMDIKMRRDSLEQEIEEIPGDIHPRLGSVLLGVGASSKEISLADEARQMLHFPPDSRAAWKGWRWETLLNPEKPGEYWTADPRYFQNAASRYIYNLSLHCYTRMSSSLSSIFCFIKLKQFEEDMLTSITEGLGLGMSGRDVFNLLGVLQ